jgi:hypothetical protein
MRVKYIKVEWDDQLHGYQLDANTYIDEIPLLREKLPPGAWAFVSTEGHYSMRSNRCVKDLELAGVSIPTGRESHLVLNFTANQWKHETGLQITYTGVSHFAINFGHSIDWMQNETVLLDEILPHPSGCAHEIALTDASIVVRCKDLDAVWGPG